MNHKQFTRDFNSEEFDSPDLLYSGLSVSLDLVQRLQAIRYLYLQPIIVISGVRTPAYNSRIGGVEGSSHVQGLAVDIHVPNSIDRFLLIRYALKVGFNRIGINKTTLHLDIDESKPQNVIWHYFE